MRTTPLLKQVFILNCIIFLFFCSTNNIKWDYPIIESQVVTDTFYGQIIHDPYRNLEVLDSIHIKNWYKAQHHFYDSIITKIPVRKALKKEISNLINRSNIFGGLPRMAGKRAFIRHYMASEQIEKLVFTDDDGKIKQELFTNKKLNNKTGKYYSIDFFEPSPNGDFLAFGLSANGTERSTIHVIEIATKIILKDSIPDCMLGNPQWLPNSLGFFYTQHKTESSLLLSEDKIHYYETKLHFMGQKTDHDKIIFNYHSTKIIKMDSEITPDLFVYPNSDYIVIEILHGADSYTSLLCASLKDILCFSHHSIPWKTIWNRDKKISCHTVFKNQVYALCYKKNQYGAIKIINLDNLESSTLSIGKDTLVLDNMIATKNDVFISGMNIDQHKLIKINPKTQEYSFVPLPYNGSVTFRHSFPIAPYFSNSDYLHFKLESWNKEDGTYKLTSENNIIKTEFAVPTTIEGIENIEVKRVNVKSYDSIDVPLSIVYKRGLKKNSNAPAILYAYGAYGCPITAYFSPVEMVWYNHGGIFCIAHIRGGGEKGDKWHKGGFKKTKPNSWKDFLACAEYLIQEGYTNPEKLAINGESAGGITIGRAITEKPDLFKAAILDVPEMNTIRHEFEYNNTQANEFGTIKDSAEFTWLYEMDTYHHIKPGAKYPSVMFSGGMNDSRVDVWQPAKCIAKLQQNNNFENIILFNVHEAGHFGTSDYITSVVDYYSFLFWQLGVKME